MHTPHYNNNNNNNKITSVSSAVISSRIFWASDRKFSMIGSSSNTTACGIMTPTTTESSLSPSTENGLVFSLAASENSWALCCSSSKRSLIVEEPPTKAGPSGHEVIIVCEVLFKADETTLEKNHETLIIPDLSNKNKARKPENYITVEEKLMDFSFSVCMKFEGMEMVRWLSFCHLHM